MDLAASREIRGASAAGDHTRDLLEAGELSKSVAHKVGFKSDAAFRSACSDTELRRHYPIIPPFKPTEILAKRGY
jgi:hypothetical protein